MVSSIPLSTVKHYINIAKILYRMYTIHTQRECTVYVYIVYTLRYLQSIGTIWAIIKISKTQHKKRGNSEFWKTWIKSNVSSKLFISHLNCNGLLKNK